MSEQQQNDQLIKGRVKGATAWVIGGHLSGQLLRLGSNLVMTRLLVPDMFGVMAVAHSLLIGLTLFSDMGIKQNIIRHQKGNEPDFLNTAWSLNIVRGVIICFFVLLIAFGIYQLNQAQWFPQGSVYSSPILPYVLAIISFSAIFDGFESTKLASANRMLSLAPIILIELLSLLIGLLVMIGWAMIDKSIWALVAGALVASGTKMACSHLVVSGIRNHWHWDKGIFRELFNFGKWIFLATIFTYLSGHGLRLLQGVLVSVEDLAFITIAGVFSWALGTVVNKLSASIVFPVFSAAARAGAQDLKQSIANFQSKMLLIVIPLFLVLSYISQDMINILYDDRYSMVGHYLGIMALNGALSVLPMYYQNAFLATGNSKQHFIVSGAAMILRVTGVILGFSLGGVDGMLFAIGAATLLFYIYVITKAQNYGWPLFKYDIPVIFLVGIGYFLIAT